MSHWIISLNIDDGTTEFTSRPEPLQSVVDLLNWHLTGIHIDFQISQVSPNFAYVARRAASDADDQHQNGDTTP
jgi:hypothetical protein|tara:strand:- start:11841 stop:12062 length:222 start_codon:yes stop_codon:yes gene_type:complete